MSEKDKDPSQTKSAEQSDRQETEVVSKPIEQSSTKQKTASVEPLHDESDSQNKPDFRSESDSQNESDPQNESHQYEQKEVSDTHSANFTSREIPRLSSTKLVKKTPWLVVVLVFLVILLAAAIGWMLYQQNQTQQSWQVLQSEFKQQLNDYKQKIQQIEKVASSSQTASENNLAVIKKQSSYNQKLDQALIATQEKIKSLSGRRQQDWLLAEAEYLINLASIKMNLDKDKKSAIALLKTADEKILLTADNSLLSLRQSISEDIAQLELVNLTDLGGIVSELDAIGSQIPKLTLIALEFKSEPTNSNKDNNLKTDWSNFYQNFLEDFIVITKHDQPIKPLMSSEQRVNLNSNIQLALQQAQVALLASDQKIYNLHLDNASEWIGEFFKYDQVSKILLDKLEKLKAADINPRFPKELESKQTIQSINKDRLYQWLEKDKVNVQTESETQTEE